MKEIMAIIRMNMVGETKKVLAESGFPSITCKNILGRGKKKVNFSMISDYMTEEELHQISDKKTMEQISESYRLISKRLVLILAKDEDVKKIVDIIIDVNQTGNPGDGKIFVTKVTDVVRIRTGEKQDEAI
ncbi:P-II family nitrogen regulator [Clostridium sp. WILCCON 0269]|uniref:P-II family nitrogen regulator n=1 Tax=Candidatus Clostridium eludens TaxID=3381663 RepID=A0ABW8SSV5_9CLOT